MRVAQTISNLVPAISVVNRRLVGPKHSRNKRYCNIGIRLAVLERNPTGRQLDDIRSLLQQGKAAYGGINKTSGLLAVLLRKSTAPEVPGVLHPKSDTLCATFFRTLT